MSPRYAVWSDAQWTQIAPLMPESAGKLGRPFKDHRLMTEGSSTGIVGRADIPREDKVGTRGRRVCWLRSVSSSPSVDGELQLMFFESSLSVTSLRHAVSTRPSASLKEKRTTRIRTRPTGSRRNWRMDMAGRSSLLTLWSILRGEGAVSGEFLRCASEAAYRMKESLRAIS